MLKYELTKGASYLAPTDKWVVSSEFLENIDCVITEFTKDTPYLSIKGKIWIVFCEYLPQNQVCYNGITHKDTPSMS